MKKIIIGLTVVVAVVGTGSIFLKYKNFFDESRIVPKVVTLETSPLNEKNKNETKKISRAPEDLGIVSSALGFSLKYPYKEVGVGWGEDGLFQVLFSFSPKFIFTDGDIVEVLNEDIHNLRLHFGLGIAVVNPVADTSDLASWVKTFLQKEDTQYGNEEKVLSEQGEAIAFAGQEGYSVTRLIEGSEKQKSPHYTRKEIFIRKDSSVYRINYLASSEDTVFPRSGEAGRKYLEYIDGLSSEILSTFVFDGSEKTNIIVPKQSLPSLTGEAKERHEKMLASLRIGPFFDEKAMYPRYSSREKCTSSLASQKRSSGVLRSLRPSPGIYVSASDGVVDEKEVVELHAYDENGGHTGPLPIPPGLGGASVEERAKNINWINLGSLGYGLSIHENINGRIEILGKKFSFAQLAMSGDGNSCEITSMFIPVTPYSIATLPMTQNGDFGPISYDIDGDGVEDFKWSLVHPLLPQKEKELRAVISDMQLAF